MTTSLCQHCGAPLSATLGAVRCNYCGKESFVGPQPQPYPPAPPRPYVPPRPRSSTSVAPLLLVGGLVAALGLSGVVFMILARSSSRTPTPTTTFVPDDPVRGVPPATDPNPLPIVPGAPEAPPPPHVTSRRICMIGDRNGDGANELTALVGLSPSDREKRPAIIDGANGRALWVGQSAGNSSDIYLLCAGERWMGILNDDNFELRLLPVEAPEREVRHILTDEVFYYGATNDCIRFRLDDNQRPSFSLRDGTRQSCDAPLVRRTHIPYTTLDGIISTLGRGASTRRDDMQYRLTTRRPGTAFLQASASRGGRELWNMPLRFVPVGGEAIGTLALVAAPNVVVVFGSTRTGSNSSEGLTALGLNAADGTERFATQISASDEDMNEVFYNGRFVVFGTYARMVAIDPAGGQIAWQLGE